MKSSELAERCGINVQSLRYYERRGLLNDPRQRGIGIREYTEAHARRVQFIKQAQTLGFTLKEISDLLALRASSTTTCGDVRGRAQQKIQDIQEKIGVLRSYQAALEHLVTGCPGAGPSSDCPILDAMNPGARAPTTQHASSPRGA